ncbi:MAG: BadF/BadG/BcrA/BcrD ATPase family protein [Chloroflexota bacterium]|nr:BadF/BadG/BcrA/BcrD ATPase family protein [Chloroflexota bacterium]
MTNQNMEQGYLLGVDVGNSKTHTLISDLSGNVLGFGETGCGSYEVLGLEGMSKALNQAAQKALFDAKLNKSDITAMGFGIAGYDWPMEKQIMIKAIESLGIKSAYEFVNDVVIGLLAGASKGWGIAVDAGTGNNVRGQDQSGRIGRITGNSVRFGEIGGAAELVWRAQIAATYAWTQRGPETKISQVLMEYAEVESDEALIEGLAMEKIHLSPIIARDIFRLAAEGDEVADSIVNFSARELGLNVNAVIKQLDLQELTFDVVLIGSTFKAGEIYIQPLRETIHGFAPKAQLVPLSVPPVVGAVLLASEVIQLRTEAIRERLITSTKIILSNAFK